jgi:DNA-binding transcriptional regulator YdaS (Cro superfamily)
MKTKTHEALEKACEIVGGQSRLAFLLNIRPPTVNQWVHLVKQIPAERCPEIEKLVNSKVICEELRPDVDWAYLRNSGEKIKSGEAA